MKSFITSFLDPSIIADITQIPARMANLHALAMATGLALFGFLAMLEILRQNIAAAKDQSDYAGMAIRLILACLGFLLYGWIFNFMTQAVFIMENAILSMKDWGNLLHEITHCFRTYHPGILTGTLSILFAWIASFLATVAQMVLYWVRYVLVSLLYFVGPLCMACLAFQPTSYLVGNWFKNVLQISLWTFVFKMIVRIFLELQVGIYLAHANSTRDILAIIGVNVTFLVVIVLGPLFTAEFISGKAFGPMAVVASTFISTHFLEYLKDRASFAWQQTGGKAMQRAAGPIIGQEPLPKTDLRKSLFGINVGPASRQEKSPKKYWPGRDRRP